MIYYKKKITNLKIALQAYRPNAISILQKPSEIRQAREIVDGLMNGNLLVNTRARAANTGGKVSSD